MLELRDSKLVTLRLIQRAHAHIPGVQAAQLSKGLELDEMDGQFDLAHIMCRKQHVPFVHLHKTA
ncbi:hypothetical protein X801_04614 [Opisthorchis viverrini]|uniref:Uncharacterized protein n=1 Tax=Opisthorchis viverrini TaxID=6198 RepID=A0A1S8WYL0_OPIVI|nr:hypothetical protein X801_04614 [Opisthorchis viverrini]